jgi:hypothetical protein
MRRFIGQNEERQNRKGGNKREVKTKKKKLKRRTCGIIPTK